MAFCFVSYPADRMKRLYDINVHGAFYTAREAAKYMIARGSGSIVLVSSMSATVSWLIRFDSIISSRIYPVEVVNIPQVN